MQEKIINQLTLIVDGLINGLDVGEIDEVEFEQSLLEQSGEELPEGEIKVQLDDGSGSLKEIIIKFK